MEEPTADEVKKVREWECRNTGHNIAAIQEISSYDPRGFVCSNCDASWKIDYSVSAPNTRAKADAWDGYVTDIALSLALLDKFPDHRETETGIAVLEAATRLKSLCERYGLESPF